MYNIVIVGESGVGELGVGKLGMNHFNNIDSNKCKIKKKKQYCNIYISFFYDKILDL